MTAFGTKLEVERLMKVTAATADYVAARLGRDRAIRKAVVRYGIPATKVAKAAGLTQAQVYQILKASE